MVKLCVFLEGSSAPDSATCLNSRWFGIHPTTTLLTCGLYEFWHTSIYKYIEGPLYRYALIINKLHSAKRSHCVIFITLNPKLT